MATTVQLELGYEFDVKASAAAVFDVLANVPESASHYPQVDKLENVAKDSYRWEMKKIGIGQVSLQTVYTSHYVANKARKTVDWTPLDGAGDNARVSGSWKITDKKKFAHVELQVTAEVTLPVPALMRVVVAPLVESEFERLTEKYIDNLIQCFGGEA